MGMAPRDLSMFDMFDMFDKFDKFRCAVSTGLRIGGYHDSASFLYESGDFGLSYHSVRF